MTDLNDKVGIPREAVTGDYQETEGLAASLFRGVGLAVINTFKGGEATFSSTRGTFTGIDHKAEVLQCVMYPAHIVLIWIGFMTASIQIL